MKPCVCGIGELHKKTYQDIYEYRGESHPITIHCSECDICGIELSNHADSLLDDNEAKIIRDNIDKMFGD